MHFAHSSPAASHPARIALVVVFHVLLGLALVKTMNVRLLARPAEPPPVTVVPTFTPPVPPPKPIDLPVASVPAPTVFVPLPDVPVAPPLADPVTASTTVADPRAPAADVTPVVTPPASTGGAATTRAAAMMDGCAKPVYPAQAARNGDTGTVTLALLVGVDGRVASARVARSSGFQDLDKAALTALSRCTFKPAMHGDVAEAGWAQIAFVWALE